MRLIKIFTYMTSGQNGHQEMYFLKCQQELQLDNVLYRRAHAIYILHSIYIFLNVNFLLKEKTKKNN